MGFLNSLKRKLRRLTELTAGERWTLLLALIGLPLAAIGRRVLSVRRLQTISEKIMPPGINAGCDEAATLANTQRTAWLVGAAASHGLIRANCLERSLVLVALLRRHGIESDLQMGARKNGQLFEAHAWVERHGIVLNDAEDVRERYMAFMTAASATEQTVP